MNSNFHNTKSNIQSKTANIQNPKLKKKYKYNIRITTPRIQTTQIQNQKSKTHTPKRYKNENPKTQKSTIQYRAAVSRPKDFWWASPPGWGHAGIIRSLEDFCPIWWGLLHSGRNLEVIWWLPGRDLVGILLGFDRVL